LGLYERGRSLRGHLFNPEVALGSVRGLAGGLGRFCRHNGFHDPGLGTEFKGLLFSDKITFSGEQEFLLRP
jgi:hypothetical protein